MKIPEALVSAVAARKAILFAGAGLSCSLGLPLFDVLEAYLGKQLDLKDWNDYDFPILAEYFLLARQGTGRNELLRWMQEVWHPDGLDISRSRIHERIVKLNFPVIYTTNYDSWIECAFAARGRAFRKVIGVSDLVERKPDEVEIIKFHGDFDDPDSIVLTESSFLSRMSLEGPLDIRLRADSLARPLLFVGYSLSDPNIRFLLFKLQELWEQHSEEKNKPPASYIVMVERNAVQERLLIQRGVHPIVAEADNATAALQMFFETLSDEVQAQSAG
ncbi:MAG: SIR2 family protein [Acidobacteriaceae bacterium]|nr:SIR2 family protein [Acidobacteriaceae bacterium]